MVEFLPTFCQSEGWWSILPTFCKKPAKMRSNMSVLISSLHFHFPCRPKYIGPLPCSILGGTELCTATQNYPDGTFYRVPTQTERPILANYGSFNRIFMIKLGIWDQMYALKRLWKGPDLAEMAHEGLVQYSSTLTEIFPFPRIWANKKKNGSRRNVDSWCLLCCMPTFLGEDASATTKWHLVVFSSIWASERAREGKRGQISDRSAAQRQRSRDLCSLPNARV